MQQVAFVLTLRKVFFGKLDLSISISIIATEKLPVAYEQKVNTMWNSGLSLISVGFV